MLVAGDIDESPERWRQRLVASELATEQVRPGLWAGRRLSAAGM
jgi:hypothetical protein